MTIKTSAPNCMEKKLNMTTVKTPSSNDQNLKTYIALKNNDELIFSYDIEQSFSSQEKRLHLEQQETGFFLTMKIDEKKEHLFIKDFSLTDNKQLENLSSGLYDAAMIEIILQGLDLLFFIAQQNAIDHSLFMIKKDEAEHLIAFEEIFKISPTHLSVEKGMPVIFFDFSLTSIAHEVFSQKKESIMAKIQQGLWKEQRNDSYLKNYLQSKKMFIPFSLKNLIEQNEKPVQEPGQVILFPKIFTKP